VRISTSNLGRCQQCGVGILTLFKINKTILDTETKEWIIFGEIKCPDCGAEFICELKGVSFLL